MTSKIKYIVGIFLFTWQCCNLFSQETDWKSLIENWRKEYNVPGLSVGIIRNDEIILSDGFGILEEGKPGKADKNTLYSIASNSKAFISASIATLVKQGKIKWDDKVQQYLPYFELYDPCVSEMITVRDLLCHRAGLGTFAGDVVWYRSNYTAEEVVRRAEEIPQAYEFRSGYGYSNVMFIAAGEVIRAVTGKSWDEYISQTFLGPLHMERTATSTDDLMKTSDVAMPHKFVDGVNDPIAWVNWDNVGAAGGIISSAEDMLKWIQFQLHHGIIGTDTLFTRSLQTTMWTPQVSRPVNDQARELYGNRNFNGYGLGWGISEYNSRLLVSHTGGYDGMYSSVMMLPTENIGVVILTNSMTSIGPMLSYEIIDQLLQLPHHDWKERGIKQDKAGRDDRIARIKQRTDARQSGTTPSLSVTAISGLYRCPLFGDIRILEDKGQLMIDFVSAPGLKAKLTHWHYDTYLMEWLEEQAWFSFGTVQIQKDNNGKPSRLLFDVPNDDIFFEEINAVRVSP